jgi:cation transport regulator
MRYRTNNELPEAIRRHLPKGAQDLYRETFNDAYAQVGPGQEIVAHRAAWAAVKAKYEKIGSEWKARRAN